jgi:putative colanic acid biosynthesis acetyltransferase WcaF
MYPVNLRAYDNSWYYPGRSVVWRFAWLFFGLPLLRSHWIVASGFRARLLRVFGARIGKRVVMRHAINIKYPWHLVVGDDCWFGEECWIDNLTTVTIGSNVCISQGAYLCTGNHNWSDPNFGLMISPIRVNDGAWIGARAMLVPGVVLGVSAVAGAGSVVVASIPDFEIHMGNPAVFARLRILDSVALLDRERQVIK